ncbi:MAG: hypothetical protein NUV65_01305 [Candidatus Roizmanbacteria bacterium]|nr:hypothetical protein [Candidatus Roizmanbacteria bacterium]
MHNYRSYLMGALKISNDELTALAITVKHIKDSTSRKLFVPKRSLELYKNLIREKLDNGFWNDIVGTDLIYFIFKMPDGTLIEYTYSEENRIAIAKLCTLLNKDPIEKTSNLLAYLAGNEFYTEEIEKYKQHSSKQ